MAYPNHNIRTIESDLMLFKIVSCFNLFRYVFGTILIQALEDVLKTSYCQRFFEVRIVGIIFDSHHPLQKQTAAAVCFLLSEFLSGIESWRVLL